MSGKLVLVVDDSESDQLIAKLVLEDFDDSIELIQAFDGQEALEIVENAARQPDIILLDINMPRMNGFEFLENYQKIEKSKSIIAMLSSSEQARDIERSMSYEFVKKYLTKPLDSDCLQELFDLSEQAHP